MTLENFMKAMEIEDDDIRLTAIRKVDPIDKIPTSVMMSLMDNKLAEIRLETITRCKDFEVPPFELLCKALKDEEENVRIAAADYICKLRNPEFSILLNTVLDDPSHYVIEAVMLHYSEFDVISLKLLKKGLRQSPLFTRIAMIRAYGVYKLPFDIVEELLDTAEWSIRKEIVQSFHFRKMPKACWKKALNDPDSTIRLMTKGIAEQYYISDT